jgi:hypothetical protein
MTQYDYSGIEHSCMGEFRDMEKSCTSGKKKILHKQRSRKCRIFFTTHAEFPMSLYSPMQERYSSMSHYIINIFLDFFKFRVFFPVKPLPPACSHANSNMSSQRNFSNPTHGSEVVNATRFGPASPRASWAKEVSQKFPNNSTR